MKIQDLIEGCKHGEYYCSTDKKWKCRTGPKQSRKVSEVDLNEFAPGAGDGDGDEDPYRYPKPESYRRSIDFFGKFEADHFDREDMNDATGEFKGYWGKTQIAYFKFDNPAKTGSDDPGMGWYYEPNDISDDDSDTGATPAVDTSAQRKQQELGMIDAFLKSGKKPNPGSPIHALMKKHGLAEGSLEEIDRRGFLKGLGAAVAGAAGVSNAKASEKKFSDFITDPADKEKYIELRKKADRILAISMVNSSLKVAAYAEMAKLKDFKKELAKKYNIDINLKEEDMAEAHPNSKIYDKCWDGYKKVPGKKRGEKGSCVEETYDGDEFFEAYGVLWFNEDEQLDEAEYQGRSVPLGKPMQGDVKKFKVYVKDPSTGNVKKVNFGDPDMKIRKSNPAARRSFRARHNCDNPGPRTKARYWSCRKW